MEGGVRIVGTVSFTDNYARDVDTSLEWNGTVYAFETDGDGIFFLDLAIDGTFWDLKPYLHRGNFFTMVTAIIATFQQYMTLFKQVITQHTF